jgi:DNA-binding NtrC family response regulator
MKAMQQSQTARILVADDQQDVLESLRLLFKGEGYEAQVVSSPAGILAALEARDFDLLLMDLNYTRDTTSGQEGLDVLTKVRAIENAPPVVVMTAWGSIDLAVEAMRRGARDFVQKPWDNERLLTVLRTQIELQRTRRLAQRLEAENRLLRAEGVPTFIAESPAMLPIRELVARVGPSDANVLVTGEHGTGKEVVARSLHAVSSRAGKPLVTVNAGGLVDGVFESELFGHVRGAFTDAKTDRVGRFELADGGTLFLDEIANMPPGQQARLLRAIETGEFERLGSSRTRRVDARILSATNANIDAEVKAGRFREDLLFRLNTVEIRIPPLRSRREDIPLLALHFLRQHALRYRKEIAGFDEHASEALHSYSWPGNVRELDHAVERAVLMARGDTIRAADLNLQPPREGASRLEDMSIEEVERFLVKKALERFGGNAAEAARFLGLSRSGLYRRLQKYGLTRS